jgi:hypothetical protein
VTVVTILGFMADAWILSTYALLAHKKIAKPFHWANAIGCFPLIVGEIVVHAWPPLVLTVSFGALGWVGVLQTDWEDES